MIEKINFHNILKNFFNQKDFTGLINFCDSKIEVEKSDYLLFGARGKAKYEIKDFEGAILDISQAVSLKIDYALGFYNRGLCYYEIKKHQLAIQDFEKAMLLKSDLNFLDYHLGECYYYLEKYDKSIESFSNYLLNFDDDSALHWRAEILFETHQFEKANIDILKLLSIDVKYIENYKKIHCCPIKVQKKEAK